MESTPGATVLLLPFPGAQGHTSPMLELGRRLAHHGLHPTYVTTRHVLSSTAPPGAPFRVAAISDGFDAGGYASCPDPTKYFSRLEAVGSETLRELLLSEEAAAVRVLVYDSHLPWARRVARAAGVPAAAFFSQPCAVNVVYGELWAGRLALPVTDGRELLARGALGVELRQEDVPPFASAPESYPAFLKTSIEQFDGLEDADDVLVNSFSDMEPAKTCEMGMAYEALRAERNQYAGELEAAMLAMAGMKDALEVREKSLEEALEANRVLTAKVERMKKQRTELGNQMAILNRRCIAQEKYVKDWAGQMKTRLANFCMDAEAEAAAVERSNKDNVPLGEEANRDLLRAHIRVGKVSPFIGRLREVVGRIEKELWPEDESRQEMESLMGQLEEIPDRVQSWKKSEACCGADVALSLVRVHCKEVRKDKLKTLKVANTKKLRFEDFMETFLETATRIADGIDLDTFVEPSSPGAGPADAE